MERRRVVIVAFEGVQSLDLCGPMEVFAGAARLRPGAYEVLVAGPQAGPVATTSGLTVHVPLALEDVAGPIDTLIVAGGDGVHDAITDQGFVAAARQASRRARRTTSVCTGAFVLAEAGLLDGRRATTHWRSCRTLERRYPGVTVDADPIFVRDGDVWTSAGVTAGIDLALALVEDDLGSETARLIARWLVVYLQRPGGQSQFSAPLRVTRPARPALRELLSWIADHPDENCSITVLARRAGMSERTLARAFRAECGSTPAGHVEAVRIEAARSLLETTDLNVSAIAARCGFGTVETLHRAFRRRLHVTPDGYRRRFRATPAQAS
jgi:transcriptional regulator GlxA family with amidase domain